MHSEGWLTHQFASSVSVEKCCFVDVRKLGQVYEDWATKEFWEKWHNFEHTSIKRPIVLYIEGK